METKVCTKCGEEKPATREFFYKKKSDLELKAECKVCSLAATERWRKKNPEKNAEGKKRYREEHKEEISKYMKRYRKNQPAAIYEIKNKETGKIYIGATTTFPKRRNHHKSVLRRGIHENQVLQEDYNKYGLDVFEFEIIEEHPCDIDFKILEKIEEETIKRLLSEGKKLYNKKNTKL